MDFLIWDERATWAFFVIRNLVSYFFICGAFIVHERFPVSAKSSSLWNQQLVSMFQYPPCMKIPFPKKVLPFLRDSLLTPLLGKKNGTQLSKYWFNSSMHFWLIKTVVFCLLMFHIGSCNLIFYIFIFIPHLLKLYC